MRAADWDPTSRPGSGWTTLKRAVLHGLQSAADLTGLSSLYVRGRGVRGATILMYHSVARAPEAEWVDPRYHVNPEEFEAQLSFLARNRRVVSMTDLAAALEENRDLPARTVVLTFDDGYLDNLTVAAPLLAKYGLPATLYLCTSYVSRSENQWIDRLYGLFRSRTKQELALEQEASARFDLSDPEQERLAYRAAGKILLEGNLERRRQCFEEIERRLAPNSAGPRLTLSWDDVRDLVRRFPAFEIGAHTCNHLDLPRFEGEVAESEIAGCAEEIRRELGTRPAHFSYPYNRWSPQSQERVRRNGYRSAVGAGTEYLVTGRSDRFAIPRIDSDLSLRRLSFVTSGAFPALVGSA